ncbi:MAG: YqgE/AlgH family protein [Myxococcales bacterium]|nr:YqgE/AlgH family protein [Myxococcales bacterium]MDD9970931.1 YqgE/AlgH family protein [Myxococcales bacterium]
MVRSKLSPMASELSPGFLVAAPVLLDPNFRRSVVLLVDHREEGSLGFVINRPGDVPLSDVVDAIGLQIPDAGLPPAQVVVGGPVAPETGWVVFEPGQEDEGASEVVRVSERMAVTASRELLVDLLERRRPGRLLVALGYAGWGPGQLDAEIAQGAWIPVGLDEEIVFETPPEDRWTAALGSLGIDPARLAAVPPGELS